MSMTELGRSTPGEEESQRHYVAHPVDPRKAICGPFHSYHNSELVDRLQTLLSCDDQRKEHRDIFNVNPDYFLANCVATDLNMNAGITSVFKE